jgi:hypothetical protein
MIVYAPVTSDEHIDPHWDRADWIVVIVDHMGDNMVRILKTIETPVYLGATGNARIYSFCSWNAYLIF